MTRMTHARPGFTLIEILVVLAIIGILMALTAAALQKTVEGQNVRSSTDHVFKLQTALDDEYERVVQKCARDADTQTMPQQLVNSCEGKARAKAIWTAFNLRMAFPDTFAEANQTLTLLDANGVTMCQASPPPTFAPVSGLGTLTGSIPPHEESGALLYLILAKRSLSGSGAMATSADDLTQASRRKVTFSNREFEAFADAWKNSIGFVRWKKHVVLGDTEIQSPPFIDPQKVNAVNKDVLDPPVKLMVNGAPVERGLVESWNPPGTTPANIRNMKTLLAFGDGNNNVAAENRMATVYSTGKTVYAPNTTTLTPLDDIFGFRLRKQGEKGYNQ